MIKAIVDSVSVSNGEVTKFSVFDDARGTVGSFQMFESDESKYGQYKVGDSYHLSLLPAAVEIPSYKYVDLITNEVITPPTLSETTPALAEEPTLIDKVKDFFSPDPTTESPNTITADISIDKIQGLDAPTFEEKAAKAFPTDDSK